MVCAGNGERGRGGRARRRVIPASSTAAPAADGAVVTVVLPKLGHVGIGAVRAERNGDAGHLVLLGVAAVVVVHAQVRRHLGVERGDGVFAVGGRRRVRVGVGVVRVAVRVRRGGGNGLQAGAGRGLDGEVEPLPPGARPEEPVLEDDALVVALAHALALDAVVARRPFLAALDAALAARWVVSGARGGSAGGHLLRHPVLVRLRETFVAGLSVSDDVCGAVSARPASDGDACDVTLSVGLPTASPAPGGDAASEPAELPMYVPVGPSLYRCDAISRASCLVPVVRATRAFRLTARLLVDRGWWLLLHA